MMQTTHHPYGVYQLIRDQVSDMMVATMEMDTCQEHRQKLKQGVSAISTFQMTESYRSRKRERMQ